MSTNTDMLWSMQQEILALGRENDRLRHGQAIEGDYVCPDSLKWTQARALIKEAVEQFNDGLNIGLGWVARAERLLDERD